MATPRTEPVPLLRIEQVAKILNVKNRTVRTLCREGLLGHVRLPHGNYCIPTTEIDRLTTPDPDGAQPAMLE